MKLPPAAARKKMQRPRQHGWKSAQQVVCQLLPGPVTAGQRAFWVKPQGRRGNGKSMQAKQLKRKMAGTPGWQALVDMLLLIRKISQQVWFTARSQPQTCRLVHHVCALLLTLALHQETSCSPCCWQLPQLSKWVLGWLLVAGAWCEVTSDRT